MTGPDDNQGEIGSALCESPALSADSQPSVAYGAGADDASATEPDERALHLRELGRSYGAIAKELGLDRPLDARSAFVRAVRQHPPVRRSELFERERERLDVAEARIRTRDRDEPETMARRLKALTRLRRGLE
jgi:hypothetical protein